MEFVEFAESEPGPGVERERLSGEGEEPGEHPESAIESGAQLGQVREF